VCVTADWPPDKQPMQDGGRLDCQDNGVDPSSHPKWESLATAAPQLGPAAAASQSGGCPVSILVAAHLCSTGPLPGLVDDSLQGSEEPYSGLNCLSAHIANIL